MAISLFIHRTLAYLADNTLIIIYGGLLGFMALLLGNPLAEMARLTQYLTILSVFTGPVVLFMVIFETVTGWSPGKRLLGLRVEPHSLFPVFVRNILKYLPWELAHIGIWIVPGQPFVSPPGLESFIAWYASLGLMAGNALIILITGRGVHDRISGLKIVKQTV